MKTLSGLFFAALALAGTAVAAETVASVCIISAEGVATQEYAPDRADLSVEIKVVSETLEKSRETVEDAHRRLVAAMKRAGLPEKDVGLDRRTLERETEWRNGRSVFLGFACTEHLTVVLRNVEKLTDVTEVLAGIEHVELNGMDFSSSREGEARREALLKAADAARQKAEALAKQAGVKITMLVELHENQIGYYDSRASNGNYAGPAESAGGLATRVARVAVTACYAIE